MTQNNNYSVKQNNANNKQKQKKKIFGALSLSTIGYLAVAFVCALSLWFYVADYDRIVERSISNVPVELILPSDKSLTVESGMNSYITVKVTGRKADINKMTANDIHAYIDASGVKDEIDRAFEVQIDGLPSGVTVVDTRDIPSVSVVLVKPVSKDFRVVDNFYYHKDEHNRYEFTCNPESVKITGSASIIESIYSVEVSGELGEITGNKDIKERIVLKDKDGDVIPQTYLNIDTTDIWVYADVYTQKELDIVVKYNGGIYDTTTAGAEIICEPSKVVVDGPLKSLEKINEISILIDEREIDGSFYHTTKKLPELSETVDIKYVDGNEDVTVTIRQNQIASAPITLNKKYVTAFNCEGYNYEVMAIKATNGEDEGVYGDEAQVVFFGLNKSIKELQNRNVQLSFSLEDAINSYGYNIGETPVIIEDIRIQPELSNVFPNHDTEIYIRVEVSKIEEEIDVESSEVFGNSNDNGGIKEESTVTEE